MAIFSRYSSGGGMSADNMQQRRTALRGLRRPTSSPQRPPAAAGAPPVNVDEKRTALQTLRAQKGTAPGVQPQAPTTPARGSPTNTAQPSGMSGAQQVRPGSDNLTGPTTAPSPLKGVTGAVPPPPPKIAPNPPINLRGQADEQAAIGQTQDNMQRRKDIEDNRAAQEGQDVTRRGGDPVLGAGQDAQDGHLDGVDTFNPFDLDDVRKQQAEDEKRLEQEWLARIAAARADAENRAGLGGFGLSGAATALVGDTEMKGAREKGQAISDLRKGQREELNQVAIDAANNIDAEYAFNTDINDDGKIGTGKPEDDPNVQAKADQLIAGLDSLDYNQNPGGDADTDPGTREEPYVVNAAQLEELRGYGLPMREAFRFGGIVRNGKIANQYVVYSDGNGRFFVVQGG